MDPNDDQFVPIKFPLAGIDTSLGYNVQKPLSTVLGLNVRACDGLTNRMRGGSRAGISKAIDAQVNGTSLIQHLNTIVVVDPLATNRLAKCPWVSTDYVTVQTTARYEEENPPPHSSTDYVTTDDWYKFQVLSKTKSSYPSIGDPNGFGSTGIGTFTMSLRQTDSNWSNPLTAPSVELTVQLITGGVPYSFMTGSNVIQTYSMTCADFIAGTAFDFNWSFTGYPNSPTSGLVMSLFGRVEIV